VIKKLEGLIPWVCKIFFFILFSFHGRNKLIFAVQKYTTVGHVAEFTNQHSSCPNFTIIIAAENKRTREGRSSAGNVRKCECMYTEPILTSCVFGLVPVQAGSRVTMVARETSQAHK
jgi:hypothetical protein